MSVLLHKNTISDRLIHHFFFMFIYTIVIVGSVISLEIYKLNTLTLVLYTKAKSFN